MPARMPPEFDLASLSNDPVHWHLHNGTFSLALRESAGAMSATGLQAAT